MPDRIPYTASPTDGLGKSVDERERSAFYSGKRWRKLRHAWLARNPLCKSCLEKGVIRAGNTVHHVVERLDDPTLAYAWGNLETSCPACHNRRHHSRKPAEPTPVHQPYNKARPMVLALDFNGVIHEHVKAPNGKGPVLIDSPAVPGAIDFLTRAAEAFTIAVVSARFARPGSSGLESLIEARSWLIAKGIPSDWITFDPDRSGRIFLTGSKVPYLVCLDDRSIRFDGTFPDPASLLAFKPWNVA